MMTFVLVVSGGRPVPDARRRLVVSADRFVPFVPTDDVLWTDDAGGLVFAAWQVGHEHLGRGSHWQVSPEAVTAFAGDPCPRPPFAIGRSWAAQLAGRWSPRDKPPRDGELLGTYVVAALDRRGRGWLATDPAGIALLYRADGPDGVVLSNRAAVAAWVAGDGGAPGRDPEAAAWVAYCGFVQGSRSTFDGVSVLSPGAVVTISDRGGVDVAGDRTADVSSGPVAVEDLLAGTEEQIRAVVRSAIALPTSLRTVELTGGKDSRLVLAALLAEGLAHDASYVTWGSPVLPDVVVASQIAARYGLAHRTSAARAGGAPGRRGAGRRPRRDVDEERTGPTEALSFEQRVREDVWATSGAVSVWDPPAVHLPHRPRIALSGQGGEILRTNYVQAAAARSRRALERLVRSGRLGGDQGELLRADVRRHLDDLVVLDLLALFEQTGDARDALDLHYLHQRSRRWFGPLWEVDRRNRLLPLLVPDACRAVLSSSGPERHAEVLTYRLMRSMAPELVRFPFADDGWSPDLIRHGGEAGLPVRARRGLAHRAPTPPRWVVRRLRRARPPTAHVGDERRRADASVEAVFRQLLDLGPSHPLAEIIDREAVAHAVARLDDVDARTRRSVHDVLTAAVWLDGGERPLMG